MVWNEPAREYEELDLAQARLRLEENGGSLCVDGFDKDVCRCSPMEGNHEVRVELELWDGLEVPLLITHAYLTIFIFAPQDVMTSVCLKSFGVFPKDTRDGFGREYFMVRGSKCSK
jgi:hypothetical protein